ncbi:hypothetical protein M3Y96_00853100 [Aphelenchoides besseyi]|nr:hypothetical protein M3Y96_00853100 [Aphelenchoides besseyi]
MILTRWENLEHSEQELLRLAATTTSTFSPITDFVQRHIGALTGQERLKNSDQFLCYYRNQVSDSPLQLVCDLGCCSNGCCAVEELAQAAPAYGWAIGMLVVFILLVVFFLGMVGLHLLTRNKQNRVQRFENGLYSASGSQISGPIYYNNGANFFGNKPLYSTSSLYNM